MSDNQSEYEPNDCFKGQLDNPLFIRWLETNELEDFLPASYDVQLLAALKDEPTRDE